MRMECIYLKIFQVVIIILNLIRQRVQLQEQQDMILRVQVQVMVPMIVKQTQQVKVQPLISMQAWVTT